MKTKEQILEDANTIAEMLGCDIRNGNGAGLASALTVAQVKAALSAAKLAGAELDVKLAEAVAYNEGKVVGADKESRDASAMGFTAAARKLVIERELEHDIDEALVESCKRAIGLVMAQRETRASWFLSFLPCARRRRN